MYVCILVLDIGNCLPYLSFNLWWLFYMSTWLGLFWTFLWGRFEIKITFKYVDPKLGIIHSGGLSLVQLFLQNPKINVTQQFFNPIHFTPLATIELSLIYFARIHFKLSSSDLPDKENWLIYVLFCSIFFSES